MYHLVINGHRYLTETTPQPFVIFDERGRLEDLEEESKAVEDILRAFSSMKVTDRERVLQVQDIRYSKISDMYATLKAECLKHKVLIKPSNDKSVCSNYVVKHIQSSVFITDVEEDGVMKQYCVELTIRRGAATEVFNVELYLVEGEEGFEETIPLPSMVHVLCAYLARMEDCSEESLKDVFQRFNESYAHCCRFKKLYFCVQGANALSSIKMVHSRGSMIFQPFEASEIRQFRNYNEDELWRISFV